MRANTKGRQRELTGPAIIARFVMAVRDRVAKAVAGAIPRAVVEKRRQRALIGLAGSARAVMEPRIRLAELVANIFARAAAVGNPRLRRLDGHAGSLGLALLCLTATGHSVARVEYNCFAASAVAAKPTGTASASFAYRDIDNRFDKWRDGQVPVTLDHRGAPAGYAKADYELLLLSVLEEVQGVADLAFEYRPIPDGDDEPLEPDALDAAYESFPGIRFVWEDTRRFGGQALSDTYPPGLTRDKQTAHYKEMRLKLGYIPTAWTQIKIAVPTFSSYLEGNPDAARYLIVHELLHGLGLGHSDNPLSVMHAGPYRGDRAGLHADDIAGLQALYGQPDELAVGEVDFGSPPAGVGLDASNSGFIFRTWVNEPGTLGDEIHVPLDRVGSSSALFHWLDGVSDINTVSGRTRLVLDACVTGLPAGTPAAIAVYQTSPRGEVFRYLPSEAEFYTKPPSWQCGGGTALRLSLSHQDYYAAQPGAWKFAIGVNGGLLAEVVVDIDAAYRPHYAPTSSGSLAVTRRGDGIFDLEARFAAGGGPEGIGFGHDWHIPGHYTFDPGESPPEYLTYIPRGLTARVELPGHGVYEVFAEASKPRRYRIEGIGFTALARGYLAVPRESGVPSLFGEGGEDGFLHVPAVDVSGSTLATALGQAGVDVSGSHLELLLKRTGHAGEQYKLVEARAAAAPATVTASVSVSGQLTLGDVAGADGTRRSMALAPVPGSNPLRFTVGTPGTSMTDRPASLPTIPPIPSLPALEETKTVTLEAPARWPLGKAVPVAYVHGYELANFSEAEIREEFFLPALRIIEGIAGVSFQVVDHDPAGGPFAGLMISLLGYDDIRSRYETENLEKFQSELEGYFGGKSLTWQVASLGVGLTWGAHDPQLGIREIRAAGLHLRGEDAGDGWERREWLRAFVKRIIRGLGVTLGWRGFDPFPYLPEPREMDALRALYGPSDKPVSLAEMAEVFNPLGLESSAGDGAAGLSVVVGTGEDRVAFRGSNGYVIGGHEFGVNDDGKIMIDTWRLGSGSDEWLELNFTLSFPAGTKNPDDADDRNEFARTHDLRAYFVDPAGNIRHVAESDDIHFLFHASEYEDNALQSMPIETYMKIGDILSARPGEWRMILTGKGAMLYETEFEVDASHRAAPASRFNKPPEVELSLDALGGGRFRMAIEAEDPEGDPFFLAWTGPGREPDILVDLNRTWRENLPEPVELNYAAAEPGIYPVFAVAVGGGGEEGMESYWHPSYIAVPHQSGVASYFPTERILHLPAIQTDDGIQEWNLRRVSADDDSDIRFMLFDSRRVEGSGVTAVSPDSQTGLFHFGKLLGFGRACGAAALLEEIPGTDPPQLRLSACDATSNRAPTVVRPIAKQEARVGSRFMFTLPDGVFVDPEGDDLAYRYQPPPNAAWLEFNGVTRTFSGMPPDAAADKDFVITVTAHDGYDDSALATFTLAVASRGTAPTLNFPKLPDATAYVGFPFSYRVGGNVFSDGDLDALSFSAAMTDRGALPAWLSFDEDSGEFRGVPAAGDVHAGLVIGVTAADGLGTSPPARFILTVAPAPAAATGTLRRDSAVVMLPYVSIQLGGIESRICMSATLSTSAGDFSFWRMSYDIHPSGGCRVPAAGHHALPVLDGHAGAMALHVPLAELASGTGRTCLAMEFALDDADFRILRLVEVAVAECPDRQP